MIWPVVELDVPMAGSFQLRETLLELVPVTARLSGAGGGVEVDSDPTVQVTAGDVADRPRASVATAVSVCKPGAREALIEKGALVSVPMLVDPSKNWTLAIALPDPDTLAATMTGEPWS